MTDIVGNRTLRSQWDETVRCYGEQPFLTYLAVDDTIEHFTYHQLNTKVIQAANFFLQLGIQKGELVAMHLHNCPEYIICWLALAQIGAVSVPLNEHFKLTESQYVIKKCDIRHIIVEPRSQEMFVNNRSSLGLDTILLTQGTPLNNQVFSLPAELSKQSSQLAEVRDLTPQDMAVILFTSGTTSYPKGAIYTHYNVIFGGFTHVAQVGMSEGDRFLSSMPCYHMDFQEMAVTPTICVGGHLFMAEHYSARRFWKQVCDHQVHFTDTMSIMNRTLMLQPVQPWEQNHCLKQIYFSMGMSDQEKEAFESRFRVKLLNCYGMTETVSGVTCAPLVGEKRWPSVGRAAFCYQIKIVDCDGKEVPTNTCGEICVHGIPGKTIVAGYYRDPEATQKLIDPDGWLHSGDRGYLDEAGFLYFVDRWGNMIKRSGENVSSSQVECILTSHPKIADAAVIGVPDSMRDEAVKAFVQLVKGETMTQEEVLAHCESHLAKFKVPSFITFVDQFPRTSTGKIQKKQLSREI